MDRFKLALVAHDPGTWVKMMFPDWVHQQPSDEVKVEEATEVEYLDEVTDADLAGPGEWRFQEPMSPEEAEKVLREMLRNPRGNIDLEDIDDQEEGWQ